MRTFKLSCEILSPIHIGGGNEIDPLSYIIKGEKLHRVSFGVFVANMTDTERSQLEGLIAAGDLIEIRKYIAERVDMERGFLYSVEVSPKVRDLYNDKIDDIQNQLLISPFIRTQGEAKSLVPGSSIKGAIRTAIISELAKNTSLAKPKTFKEEYQFEAKVLGYKDAKNDPFRGVKIRDRTLRNDSTIIREVRNMTKKNGGLLESNDIQIICEVSHSWITGKSINFETEISFDEALFSTHFLSKILTKKQMVKSCTDFYRNKMEGEHKKFYQDSETESCSTQLLDTSLDENSFLLRVGRFSGAESVTLDNYRNPRPPGNRAVWGTTRNLVEGKYPAGWVKVMFA